jgi:hypothetical protein
VDVTQICEMQQIYVEGIENGGMLKGERVSAGRSGWRRGVVSMGGQDVIYHER